MNEIKPLTLEEQLHYSNLLFMFPNMKLSNARKEARRLAAGKPSLRESALARKAALKALHALQRKHIFRRGFLDGRRGRPCDSNREEGCESDLVYNFGFNAGANPLGRLDDYSKLVVSMKV